MQRTSKQTDSPHVLVFPPIVYLGALCTGAILHFFWPITLVSWHFSKPLGILLIGLSALLSFVSASTLVRSGTNVDVRQPTLRIVIRGPYRFTRNPIYLAMTLFVVGMALWLNTVWMLATLLPTLLTIHFGVIQREEAYLETKFGQEYRDYTARVPRWI